MANRNSQNFLTILFVFINIKFIAMEENHYNHIQDEGYELEMLDLLGLTEKMNHLKRQPTLRNSASKFLLKVYNEIQEEEEENYHSNLHHHQFKRSLPSFRQETDDSLITKLDWWEIDNCNDIITFSSRSHPENDNETIVNNKVIMNFNINDVPKELTLVHSALRMYQDPAFGAMKHFEDKYQQATLTIYKRFFNERKQQYDFKILSSLNTTLNYKGWLEFNVTDVLRKWLQYRTLHSLNFGNDLYLDASLMLHGQKTINPRNLGLILNTFSEPTSLLDFQPFMIGYFNGPELLVKIQKLRFKRELVRRKRQLPQNQRKPTQMANEFLMKPCERLNFTLEFKDLQLHNTIIAPKKFDAFFCGGQCNFPLGSKMNATNHAIVQTLMHLKKPHLPKPCCVPTVLGSISILYYLNEDSVNLKKIPQSVAKECGCH